MTKTSHLSNYEVVYYSLCWIVQIYKLAINFLSPCKEPMIWIFCVIPNTPQSYTMQVMWT